MGLKVTSTGKVKKDASKGAKIDGDLVVTGQINAGTSNVPPDASVTTAKIADGALSANATGRGKMADGFTTTAKLGAGAATLPKVTFTGLKVLAADGVNSGAGDQEVALAGSAVGDRVVAIFGQVKANTGAHSFLIPVIGTDFEATISVINKIVQKQAAGDLSLNTYLFILAPATA